VGKRGLRVIEGSLAAGVLAADPVAFQDQCVEAYLASWVARGFSPVTIENDTGVLERMLALLGCPAWEATADDIDRVAGALAASGLAASTRRGYVQAFKGFHRFLAARKAAEIEAAFGIRIECPVDEFNASRHVGDDSPAQLPPPSPARLEGFFAFLRGRIATARKYGPAARDYALFRTLYHAGLRADEASMLDRPDLHFGRGPFGKVHVRFGKGARTSGPRPRWCRCSTAWTCGWRGSCVTCGRGSPTRRCCSPMSPAGGCTVAPSATGCGTCWSWKAPIPESGSARTRCGGRVPPITMSGAWTWWRSSRCSGTGRSGRRCGMSGRRRRSSKMLTGARSPIRSPACGRREKAVRIRWRLRMAAAQREVWTGAQLRRLLAERAGLEMSSASVSALFGREPAQLKLSTLAALCTALQCTPDDLFEVDATPVERPAAPPPAAAMPQAASGGRSMPPM
jgi:DNA-binding Xre family transcriptional regulator